MHLALGFSPCPNDTFIFDALVNKKIDTEGLEFTVMMEDVETLNEWGLKGKLDISKLSFPALFRSLDNYLLLDSGSALGKGVGPLLVSKNKMKEEDIEKKSIAIPGSNTTANMILSFAYPGAMNKIPMVFSSIEDAVLAGTTELGVIIHENRFTYKEKGLEKVADLGEVWEQKMKLPIPLGGIAVNRRLTVSTGKKLEGLIRRSLEFAFSNYPRIADYVKQHSQTMSEDVMRQHIDLYVNDYSLSLGKDGRKAVEKMFEVFLSMQKVEEGDWENKVFFST
jgi:1,4-dihydroxy-6-naphthoate synthase